MMTITEKKLFLMVTAPLTARQSIAQLGAVSALTLVNYDVGSIVGGEPYQGRRPTSSSAVIELTDMPTATLHLDRMFGLQIDPRRDDLVAAKVLTVTIAAHPCFSRG